MSARRERIFRYISCRDLELWLAVGWTVVGQYRSFGNGFDSFILEWLCDCPLGAPWKDEISLDKGTGTPYHCPHDPNPVPEQSQ